MSEKKTPVTRRRAFLLPLAVLTLTIAPAAEAQEPVHWDVVRQIRAEAFESSRVMDYAGHLTDVIGPRLTGSENMRQAQAWAMAQLGQLGLANIEREAWGDQTASWDVERISVHLLEPDYQMVIAYPLAFTPGTVRRRSRGSLLVLVRPDLWAVGVRLPGRERRRVGGCVPAGHVQPPAALRRQRRDRDDRIDGLGRASRSALRRPLRRGRSSGRPFVVFGRLRPSRVLPLGSPPPRRGRAVKHPVRPIPSVPLSRPRARDDFRA